MKISPFYRFFALLAVLTFGAQDGRAATFPINNAVITGTSSISGVLTNSASETIFGTLTFSSGSIARFNSGSTLSLGGTVTGSSGVIPITLINNPIALLITGSASPAANSASLSMLFGSTLTVPATGTVGLLGTAQTWSAANTFSSPVKITDSTASTGTTSGAAIIVGGLGVQGALYGTGATFSGNLVVQGTTFTLGNGLVTYDAGTGQFRFSSFGGHATLNDYGGNLGLGITAPVFGTTPNGAVNATATYSSTTWGPTIQWKSDLFYYNIGAGGSTQAAAVDGVAQANRFFISNGNTVSMTIESVSGAITAWRGLAVTGSNSFLTVSTAAVFAGAITASTGGTLTGTFAGAHTLSGNVTHSGAITVGATGTAYTGFKIFTVSASSGTATITDSALTSTSVAFFTVATAGGTLGQNPRPTYNTGSMSFAVTATDTSTYSVGVFIK